MHKTEKDLQAMIDTALELKFMFDTYIKRYDHASAFEQPAEIKENDYIRNARDKAEEVYRLLVKEAVEQEIEDDNKRLKEILK